MKTRVKMARVVVADVEADLADAQVGIGQKRLGGFDALPREKVCEAFSGQFFDFVGEIGGVDAHAGGDVVCADVFGVMATDPGFQIFFKEFLPDAVSGFCAFGAGAVIFHRN